MMYQPYFLELQDLILALNAAGVPRGLAVSSALKEFYLNDFVGVPGSALPHDAGTQSRGWQRNQDAKDL